MISDFYISELCASGSRHLNQAHQSQLKLSAGLDAELITEFTETLGFRWHTGARPPQDLRILLLNRKNVFVQGRSPAP